MFEISNKLFLINKDFNYSLRVYFWTSLGVYFFILFFQPFVLNYQDFSNQLLYISGFSVITFVSLVLFFIVLPWILPNLLMPRKHETRLFVLINSLAWMFCTTGFTFYIRYVGHVDMSMYLAFKIGLLCLVPIVILAIIRENESLRHRMEVIRSENVTLQMKIQDTSTEETELLNFISDNRSDSIDLHPELVLLIKSADNYVEIVYLEDNIQKKKLIRTTLKNIEVQLKANPIFIRCHRTCIVNTSYIIKLSHGYPGHRLKIHGYQEEIPVSRQYLLAVRDILNIT